MSINFTQIELMKALKEYGKDMKILYVEDNFQVQSQYKSFLSKIFQQVDTASDGMEGFAMGSNARYDIVISDIHLPLLDGLSMIEKIKHLYPDQATLLISAHKDVNYLHHSIELGINGYIYKPIDQTKIIKTLHKIVTRIKIQHEMCEHTKKIEKLLEIKKNEIQNIHHTDNITGLSTLEKLEQDIHLNPSYSLALLKIKNFKHINDLYGYLQGNLLLMATGNFLVQAISEDARLPFYFLYRLSGAHFAILSNVEIKILEEYIHSIILRFESSEFKIDQRPMMFEMNAGLVDGNDKLSISNADSALREAEISGSVITYHEDISTIKKRTEMLHCEDQIKRAIKDDRFVPYYQPIIDNKTQTIHKYEALARLEMCDEDNTIIYPGSFMAVAKKTKLYHNITRIIIQKALNDFSDSECMVSLNISIDDINNPGTCAFIFNQIAIFPEPKRIVFELLESEGIGSYDQAQIFFNKVKEYGCRVAIDDFGTGYSNFEHLANLNIDYIKIDGSLIQKLHQDHLSYTIVEMISAIANKIGCISIAEFVSDDTIRALTAELGIHESQGYLYGKAVSFTDSMKKIQPASFATLS
jgi:EAL domain-containing protein (putative c-di-GMP-specific phosphodiesterase class I)/PleD family two-component response regulator